MSTKPVFINLLKIQLPLAAFLSITHRVTGVLIFFLVLPASVYFLSLLLSSESSYMNFLDLYGNNLILRTFVLFLVLIFTYHVFTGARHMLLDFHLISETLSATKTSSIITLILFLINGVIQAWVIL